MSGCAAAIAAARSGLRVLVVERQSMLGGMATAGHVSHWLGGRTQAGEWVVGGLFREIAERAVREGVAILPRSEPGRVYQPHAWLPWFVHGVPLDPFGTAALLERMLHEEGVGFLYETEVVGVDAADGRIGSVCVHGKDGFRSVPVKVVIDATGDADVAALGGFPVSIGRPEDGLTAPASLTFHVSHVDHAALAAEIERSGEPKFRPLIDRLRAAGEWPFPYDIFISVKLLEDDVAMINTSRLTEVDGLSPESRTDAYERGRREAFALLDVFRRRFPGFAAAQMKSIAPMLGVRETRRIVSVRTMTVDDLSAGRDFPDTIGFSMYGWDLPDPKRPSVQPLVDETDGGFVNRVQKSPVTPIPFGIMVPKGAANLLCPGRAIGVERDVLGPLRVMAPCMAMGEACGVASARLAEGVPAGEIDAGALREELRARGCIVDRNRLPEVEPRRDP